MVKPQLKFKDDKGQDYPDWETKKLGDVILSFNDLSVISDEYPLMTSSKEGLTLQSEYFNKQTASKDNKGYKIVPRGYFTYRSMSDTGDFTFNIQNILDYGIVSPAYPVFNVNSFNYGVYLEQFLNNTDEIKKQLYQTRQGSTRYALSFTRLSNLIVNIPEIEEQQKIGQFFSVFDERIEHQDKQVADLENYKKALMQKIFSQELRFKDDKGQDYPDWETKKLGDVISKGKAGGTPSTRESLYWGGSIPFLSITDITRQGKFINCTDKCITEDGLNNSSAWVVPEDSLIYSMYASVGEVCINNIELVTSQAMFSMRFKKDYDLSFVYYNLENFKTNGLSRLIETGSQGNINASLLKSFEFNYPKIEEQQKIGQLFKTLDDKIAEEKNVLDGLKLMKKGLLQQMLV